MNTGKNDTVTGWPLPRYMRMLCVMLMTAGSLCAAPDIIFKFDDLQGGTAPAMFQRAADMIVISNGGRCTFGTVYTIELDTDANFVKAVSNMIYKQSNEIWFHGYTGNSDTGVAGSEFNSTPIAYQTLHFDLGIQTVLRHNDFLMRTYAPHWNSASTTNTWVVINANPYIQQWVWPYPVNLTNLTPGKGIITVRDVDIETAPGYPDFDFFTNKYLKNTGDPYMVLQGHCAKWNYASTVPDEYGVIKNRWTEYARIVDFLVAQGCKFITFQDYYNRVNGFTNSTPPPAPAGLNMVKQNSTTVVFSWNQSIGAVPVDCYKIYRNNAFLDITTNLSYTDDYSNLNNATEYRVAAINKANISSARSAAITLSNAVVTAPAITGAPAGFVTNRSFTITLAVDTNCGYWSTNGSPFVQFTASGVTVTIDRTTTLRYFGSNAAGVSVTNMRTYTFDTDAPVVTCAAGNLSTNRAFTVYLSVNEANGYCSINGGAYQQFALPGTEIMIDKTAELSFFGRDALGNTSGTNSRTYTVSVSAVGLDRVRYARNQNGVVFSCIPENTSGEVFSISGKRIAALSVCPDGLLWNIMGTDKRMASPGVYLCRLATSRDMKIVKIIVK